MASARTPAAADNPFLTLQSEASAQITTALDAYRIVRDQAEEQIFFGVYGSPLVQALLGLKVDEAVRLAPDISPEQLAARKTQTSAYEAMLGIGGFDEALTRAVLYVIAADRSLDQRCALALNVARQQLMHLSLAAFKVMVRDQFFVLQLEPDRAIEALAALVPEADARTTLLDEVRRIVSAGRAPAAAASERLARLAQVLETPENRARLAAAGSKANSHPADAVH